MRGVGSGIKEFKDAVKRRKNQKINLKILLNMSFTEHAWNIFNKSVEDYHYMIM